MKIKKRLLSLALSGVMVLGLMPGMTMTALAADNVSTYTLQIPSTLNVSAAGWNETSGLTAAVSSGDTFDSGKKLSVTAASANSWSLKSGDNSVGYNLATATGTYSSTATPASWEFTAAELNSGTTKTMGIIVEDYSSKPAGTYQDTVNFTAKVEDSKPEYYNKLTSGAGKVIDQISLLKGFGRGYTSYNSSLTAAQAYALATYQAAIDGKAVYVIMSVKDNGYEIHYALSTDTAATEHSSELYDLLGRDPESAGLNLYYVAQ